MKSTKIADRYARAFLQEALSKESLEEVSKDMKTIAADVRKGRDLRVLLKSPVIRTENKINVLEKYWGEKLGSDSMGMVRLVCRKGREMYLGWIAERFHGLYKEHKNIVTAEVRTAVELDDELREAIVSKVQQEEGQEVDLIERVEPELIGGMVLKVGDRQYDGSVIKQLRKLRGAYQAS